MQTRCFIAHVSFRLFQFCLRAYYFLICIYLLAFYLMMCVLFGIAAAGNGTTFVQRMPRPPVPSGQGRGLPQAARAATQAPRPRR